MFKYELNVNDYKSPVRLDITAYVEDGLTPEDYKIVRDSFTTLELLIRKYEQKHIKGLEEDTDSLS